MKRTVLLLITLLMAACNGAEPPHSHGGDHAHGDHGHDHDSDGRPTRVVTAFADGYELFVEYPELAVGGSSRFVAHFTRLDGYTPVTTGKAAVVLTSGDRPGENWEVEEPAREGIFLPTARPRYAGSRSLFVVLSTNETTVRFDLGVVPVAESVAAAAKVEVPEPGGDIAFLKEQQWKVDFGLQPITRSTVRPSVVVHARVRPASDAEARVTAPLAGRIVAEKDGLPEVGESVTEGQILARIVPRLDAGEISRMRAGATQSQLTLRRATRERERIAALVEQGALPRRRLADAEHAVSMAEAEAQQARSSLGQYQSMESSRGAGTVVIRAPVAGVVAERSVVDGAYVESGEAILHVVDRSRLWLEARVPEASLDRMGQPTGAWFELPDRSGVFEVPEGRVVAFGQVVDPSTRTVPLIFALSDPPPSLRVGAFVRAHVLTGEPRDVPVVPASAILEDEGVFVAFVMRSGESFQRTIVELGVRDRGQVEVVSGVDLGEWVVAPGAYFVKLASASTGSVGHGHAH